MKRNFLFLAFIAALLLLAASCKKPDFNIAPTAGSTGTIANYLNTNFDLSLFSAAVQKAGLADSLDQIDAAYTVWAPTNAALNKDGVYAATDFDKWPADSLRYFVRNHILPEKLFYSDLPVQSDNKFSNLNGINLYVSKNTASTVVGQIYLIVDGVNVQPAPSLSTTTASQYGATELNGVVYPISSAIKANNSTVQDFLSSRSDLTHLVAGLKKFGLWDRLSGNGPFTVVAPQDSAFERYGLTLDSINRLDPSKYDPGLFGGYCMAPNHFFLLDITQLSTTSSGAFSTFSDSLSLLVGVSYNMISLMSVCIERPYITTNAKWIGPGGTVSAGVVFGTRFLGEAPASGLYYYTSTTPPYGKYCNYSCADGVVHLLSGIILRPSDVAK